MQSRREPHEKIKGWGNTYESMVATVCRPSRPYTFNGWPLWLLGSGTVAKESANATTRVGKYQDDLTALEDRMALLLTRYTKQFASMDSIVGQTRSTQSGLTSSFAGLMAMYTKN